jgi:hypothetical protein
MIESWNEFRRHSKGNNYSNFSDAIRSTFCSSQSAPNKYFPGHNANSGPALTIILFYFASWAWLPRDLFHIFSSHNQGSSKIYEALSLDWKRYLSSTRKIRAFYAVHSRFTAEPYCLPE